MVSIPYTAEMKHMYNEIEGREWTSSNWLSKRYLVGVKSWIRGQNNAYIK